MISRELMLSRYPSGDSEGMGIVAFINRERDDPGADYLELPADVWEAMNRPPFLLIKVEGRETVGG